MKIVFPPKLGGALAAARTYHQRGIRTSISHLPVVPRDPRGQIKERAVYHTLLDSILESSFCDVTLKVPQFGLPNNVESGRETIIAIVEEAQRRGIFVWIDMEQKQTVDYTIALAKECHDRFGNVGICLQAYLKRTANDLDALAERGMPIRLVKGFYRDCEFDDWQSVTENYRTLMTRLFASKSERPCVGTHDKTLIEETRGLIEQHRRTSAEIHFFRGVRDDEAVALAATGLTVRVYIPYGNVLGFILTGFTTFDNWRHLQRWVLHKDKII